MAKPDAPVPASSETPQNHLDETERLVNMAVAQESVAPATSHQLLLRAMQNLVQYIRKNV